MRRILPGAAIIVGARLLVGGFMLSTARNESFFDYLSTPIALALVVGGAYFLLKDND